MTKVFRKGGELNPPLSSTRQEQNLYETVHAWGKKSVLWL
jgi:hypothetical protein